MEIYFLHRLCHMASWDQYLLNKLFCIKNFRNFFKPMRSGRSLLILVALLHCINTAAQTHIGISLNIGNRQQFDPDSKGFSKALAPSGSLFINQKKTLKNEWKVQYGATVGIVPYKLNVIGIDTITATDSGVYPFPDYSTLFISADLQPGRQISIGKNKNLLIALGGGLTYYTSFFPTTTYQIEVTDNNESFTVFKGKMDAPEAVSKVMRRLFSFCRV